MLKYALGIDISARDFHACISSTDQQQVVNVVATSKFSNAPNGFKSLVVWMEKHRKRRDVPIVALMATGVYYEGCAFHLFKAGYHVSVVLPNKAKKYLQATGPKTKNDTVDAKGLARMAAEQSLGKWQPMSEYFFMPRSMTRQLQSLQEARTSVSNQLHAAEFAAYHAKAVTKQPRALIKTLEKQVLVMERAIEKHLLAEKEVAERVQKMCRIKGVGMLTIAVLLAETNGFALFENGGQLASYAGYDVVENQSGGRIGKTRISKRGNHRIRRAMHMPALNVVRYQVAPFTDLFNRTHKRHGIKMKSYVAVQKRLLVILYTLWKKNEAFVEQISADEEAVHVSRLTGGAALEKGSPEQVEATQGRHPHLESAYAASRLTQI